MNNLARYRKLAGMTQTDLANRIGVARNTVNSYEHDEYDPGLRQALKICMVLLPEVPLQYAFGRIWPNILEEVLYEISKEEEPE